MEELRAKLAEILRSLRALARSAGRVDPDVAERLSGLAREVGTILKAMR